jgi:hypothetical protein
MASVITRVLRILDHIQRINPIQKILNLSTGLSCHPLMICSQSINQSTPSDSNANPLSRSNRQPDPPHEPFALRLPSDREIHVRICATRDPPLGEQYSYEMWSEEEFNSESMLKIQNKIDCFLIVFSFRKSQLTKYDHRLGIRINSCTSLAPRLNSFRKGVYELKKRFMIIAPQ